MEHGYWNELYVGWGWFLGIWVLDNFEFRSLELKLSIKPALCYAVA